MGARRRSLAIWVSSFLMMLFLSASAVGMPSIIEEPATASARAGADQQLVLHLDGNADLLVVHRALAKLRAKGQVGRTLFSSAVSVYVEGSADVVAELEGISGVAKVTLRNVAHPGSSLPNASSRGASQLAERWLRLDSKQPVEQMWPQILKSLNRWQAEGTVSEFERVGLDVIRVVMASDGISELETLSGVLEISDAPLTDARQGGKALVEKGGVSADSAQRGPSADESKRELTTYRPYWLVLKPTGSADGPLPSLLKELGRLQATGVVREFDRTLKDNSNNILKVIATLEAEEALHKLPTVLDVATMAPATTPREGEGGALSRSLLTPTPTAPPTWTPEPTSVGGGSPTMIPEPTGTAEPTWTREPTPVGGNPPTMIPELTRTAEPTPVDGSPATPTMTRTPVGGGLPVPTEVGGGPPPPTPTPWVGGGGGGESSIAGTVTAPDGTPLEGVEVVAFQYYEGWDYWEWMNGTATDANGEYTLPELPSGTYRVGFFDGNGSYLEEFYNDAHDLENATDVVVGAAEAISDIDAQLDDGGHITGTVTDENGNPLANVGVEVYQYNQMYDYWLAVNYAVTDANGQYDVARLRTGSARVGFFDWEGGHLPEFYDNAPDLDSATDISVTIGEMTTGIDAQLADGAHITGTVTDQNGNPLAEVTVQVYQQDQMHGYWYPINHTVTDANGQYDAGGLRGGTYRVGFDDWMGRNLPEFYDDAADLESATDITVASGETTTGIDAQLADGGHITGTVSDENGHPLPQVGVEVYQYQEMYGDWVPMNYGYTDESGQYDVAGLRSGTYRVGFNDWTGRYLPEFYLDAPDLDSATDVSVTFGETTTGIDAQLDDGDHITGTVSDENGNPLPEVGVEVYQYDQRYRGWMSINYGHTNASGEYDVAGLRSGTYRVGFFDWMGGHLPEFYNDAQDVESATDIVVTEGETTTNIDANLSQGGQITGVVSDPDGNPLSDVSVEVRQYQEAHDYWESVNYGYTDSNGQYEIAGLRSGTYRLAFFHWEGRYLPEFYNDAADVESATDIVVTQGETTSDISVSLSEGGHITGTITDANGTLLPEVAVEVYHYNSEYNYWEWNGYAVTDSTGKYDVPGLMSGTYRVAFLDWQGRYLPEYYDNAADLESATDVPVTAEQTTEGINASLSEGGHITGSITNADGNPVPDIAVEVYQYHETEQVWLSIHYGHTDGSGRYDVGGLQSGTYRVGFFDWQSRYVSEFYNDAPDLQSATDIEVTEAQTTSGIDAQLGEGGHITGTVRAPDGSALPSVSIEVHRLDSNGQWVWAGWGETNFDGHYDVSGLNTGTYRIGFFDWASGYLPEYYNDALDLESATDISVTQGETTEGIDVQLAEGGHITGVVTTADGDGLLHTSIEVYRRDANGEWEWAGSGETFSDGSYDVAGLPTGSYRVGFLNWEGRYANEYYDNAPDLESAVDVAVTAGETTEGINASLEMGGTITGQISAPDGSALFDVSVEVYRLDANDNWEVVGWGYTHFDGQYEVNGLASGTYRVGFQTWGMTYFTKYYSDASDLASATDVSVTQGETTSEIDVTLEEGGHITGTVTREEASGRFVAGGENQLADVHIEAYRQNGDGEWEWAGWGMTDGSGQYDIAGLATGTYRVGFLEPFGFYAYEYYDDAANLESATDIAVTAGQTTPNIDAALGDPADAVADATSQSGSVVVDPQTGEITIVQQNGNQSDVTVSKVVTCSDDSSPSDVTLMVGDNSYPMSATENSNEYSATIPAAQVVDGAEIKVTKVCNNNSDEETIGQIELFDPSGYITDEITGAPVVGANVTLYKVPGWQARTGAGEKETPNTCQSNLSKAADEPWSQAAPTDLGVMAATDSSEIDPATNPLVTDAEGYYGWDVAAGCWYVVVEAAGYDRLVSPVVGVPPEVTDLNLALTPANTPVVQFSATTYQVNENQDAATIEITLGRALTETVIVEYNTTNQTATAGEDYTEANGTITISAGETVKTFNVTIHNDDAAETNETISLTLNNPNKAILGTANQATLTIMDDDGADSNNENKIYLPVVTSP
ncbi:MAG: carboxypeptidase regulatory-like domain-containing protein [Ardenticatenaceae bacterium]